MVNTTIRGVRIAGTGMYVPKKVVTNFDLAKLMDTSDEWIQQRSGIVERRYAEEGEHPSDLALQASKNAIAAAGITPPDIDLILVATLSPEHYFPGTSVFLQKKLGLSTTPAMDIRCQCSGFIYGMKVAQGLIASGQYNRILLCGVEVHSRGLDFSSAGRDVTVLFGDGAGAIVLEASDDPKRGLLHTVLHAQGEFADKLWMPFPSMCQMPFIKKEQVEDGSIAPKMEGRFVFKHAVTRMPEVVAEALEKAQLSADEIDLFVFHQANLRINEACLDQLKQPREKAFNNIQRYGNCSAASIPMCLDEAVRAGRLRAGQLVCMAAFGSGFTWASAILRW